MDLNNPILKHIQTGRLTEVIKSPFTVGRSLVADFVIESRVVSRIHFTFQHVGEAWTLFDSSTNGTLVNEELYKGIFSAILKHNDEICLGLPEQTYKFLLRDENVPNFQIENPRLEENDNFFENESVGSSSSFGENSISDDVLNNLADDLLREDQKDEESKLEDENQPSTSSKAETSGAQVNLPTSSNQSVQHLNNNDNDVEQNNEFDLSTSSLDTIIDFADDYERYIANEAPQPVPNSAEALPTSINDKFIQPSSSISTNNTSNEQPFIIDITDDEPNEFTPSSSTSKTSNESELVHPITIDITDDDTHSSNSCDSASTELYFSSEELQNNENVAPTNSFATSAVSANNHERIDWKIINTGNPCTAAGVTSNRILLVRNPCPTNSVPESSRLVSTTSSILQVPSSTSVASQANIHKRIRIHTFEVVPSASSWISSINPRTPPLYESHYSAMAQNLGHTSTCTSTGNNVEEASGSTRDIIGNVQAGSSPLVESLDSRQLTVANTVDIQADISQNTETNAIRPLERLQDFQRPGTSKDSEKYEKIEEPAKKPNQVVDQNKYEEMEDELMCIICSNLFIKAVTLGCSHSFCQHCIDAWKKNKTDCPICRTKMVSSTRTLVLDNIIEKMMDNASEEEKKLRKEVVDERQKIADQEIEAKNRQQQEADRNARGQGRNNRRRYRQYQPPGPVQHPIDAPDSPSSSDSSSNLSDDSGPEAPFDLVTYIDDFWDDRDHDDDEDNDDDDFNEDDDYNGLEGVYFGGYGRCFNCGDRGHWANGCPYR